MRSYVSCLLAAGSLLGGCAFAPNTPTIDFGEVIVGDEWILTASWVYDRPVRADIDQFSVDGSAFSTRPYPQPFASTRTMNLFESTPNVNVVFHPRAVGPAQGKITPMGSGGGPTLVATGTASDLKGTGVLQVVPSGSNVYVNPGKGFALGTPGATSATPLSPVPWRGKVDFGTVVLPNAGSWRTVTLSNPDATDRTMEVMIISPYSIWSAELTATATSPLSKFTVPAGGEFTVVLHYHPAQPSPLDTATAYFITNNGMPHILLDLQGKARAGE